MSRRSEESHPVGALLALDAQGLFDELVVNQLSEKRDVAIAQALVRFCDDALNGLAFAKSIDKKKCSYWDLREINRQLKAYIFFLKSVNRYLSPELSTTPLNALQMTRDVLFAMSTKKEFDFTSVEYRTTQEVISALVEAACQSDLQSFDDDYPNASGFPQVNL